MKIIDCPYCECHFVSESDLNGHLDRFGRIPHQRALRYAHVRDRRPRQYSEVERVAMILKWRENWGRVSS